MPARPVYFLSDAHFSALDSPLEAEKRRRWEAFLAGIAGAEHLYVVGDLFDFWFEYRRVVPRGFTSVLHPLRTLRISGTPVTVIGGNHDFWLGSFLADEIGLALEPDGLVAEHQGRRLKLDHGDETLSDDRGYMILKSIIRNRAFVGAARLVHPDLTFWVADRLSALSRRQEDRARRRGERRRSLRLRSLLEGDFDALVLGHLHLAFHYRHEGRDLLCLGDWIRRFSYAKLEGGELSLHDDRGNAYPPETVTDPDLVPSDRVRRRRRREPDPD